MKLTSEKYDIIVLDAFMDISEETCAPEPFLTEKFVRKVRERLNSNGVFAINTLPHFCSKYSYERNLYHSIFGKLYISSFAVNTVILAQKGKVKHTRRQIESRVNYYKKPFVRLGTDAQWIAESFSNFKRYKRNELFTSSCDLFSHTFLDNVCSI